jgi:hypothetical protein
MIKLTEEKRTPFTFYLPDAYTQTIAPGIRLRFILWSVQFDVFLDEGRVFDNILCEKA